MKAQALILLALVLTLTACGGKSDKTASGQAAQPAAQSSGQPAPASKPAAQDPKGTAPSEASVSFAGAKGTAAFKDKLATLDQLLLTLSGLPAPPAGKGYQGWLVSEDSTQLITIGMLPLRPDGGVALEWNSPNSENLAKRYASVQVTLESSGGSARPSGKPVLVGKPSAEALARTRQLFVSNQGKPATPLDTAFATGLVAQTGVAIQHVTNAANAIGIGSLPAMRSHLEHVVNILQGKDGPQFGDYDGNGFAENPGDGFGVRGYAEQIAALLADDAVKGRASEVASQIKSISEEAIAAAKVSDAAAALPKVQQLKGLADRFMGEIVPALYEASQTALVFDVRPD